LSKIVLKAGEETCQWIRNPIKTNSRRIEGRGGISGDRKKKNEEGRKERTGQQTGVGWREVGKKRA